MKRRNLLHHHKRKLSSEYISIKSVEYISCSNCQYNLVGKFEKRLQIAHIGSIVVFEVTTTWICLRRCQIQDERVHIREVREIR